jgi:2-keto-4-pentenoate hydratase/2-oxohepta-3-ene-1,7-dioic acid hydratase in catechol pathway
MKLARMQTQAGIVSGRFEDGTLVTDHGAYEPGRDGSLVAPSSPSAVYCVGRNFAATLDQMDYDRPDEPGFFIKPPAAVTGPEQPIRYPVWTDELTYAGELVAVIESGVAT